MNVFANAESVAKLVSDKDVSRAGIAYCLAKRENSYHIAGMRAALEGFAKDFIERNAIPQTQDEGEAIAKPLISLYEGKTGVELIAEERRHQLRRWSRQHDDKHNRGELRWAAMACLIAVTGDPSASKSWPFEDGFVYEVDSARYLIKAGALLAAEIERKVRSVCGKDTLSAAPPADSTIVEALFDSLEEILNYDGGADNALEDEYVMDRARTLLAGRK